MRSDATTVEEYLEELPEDRRSAIETVRKSILKSLPEGYEEAMNWGMVSYEVPLSMCPKTYNGQPLLYAALASQKNRMTIYLSGVFAESKRREEFEKRFRASGKKLNAGKSCVHFRKLEDLPLDLIEETIASLPVKQFVELYQRGRKDHK